MNDSNDEEVYYQKNWTKKLYIKHPYPDNYVDKSFLQFKKINVNARIYSYWSCVSYSGLILHQLSSVLIFVLIYIYLHFNLIRVQSLMLYYVAPICLLAYFGKMLVIDVSFSKIRRDILDLIKFLLFTYGLSPILNSLTESISSDTIYRTSAFMLFLNLVFHDYYSNEVAIASKTLSFNAALFACVCLASRFHTSSFHTFSLMTIAFFLFALWPEYRRYLQNNYPKSTVMLTIVNLMVCVAMLVSLKFWYSLVIYLTLFLIISFICPAILIKLQVYKRTIHGPWDEASIQT